MTREDAEALFDSVELHARLGLSLREWRDGEATLAFAPPAWARSPGSGIVHGGAIATALDTAACFALIAAVGADCSTIDLRTDYLRPATGDELRVVGSVLRAGRRFGCAEAALSTVDGRLLATARGTFTPVG